MTIVTIGYNVEMESRAQGSIWVRSPQAGRRLRPRRVLCSFCARARRYTQLDYGGRIIAFRPRPLQSSCMTMRRDGLSDGLLQFGGPVGKRCTVGVKLGVKPCIYTTPFKFCMYIIYVHVYNIYVKIYIHILYIYATPFKFYVDSCDHSM